MGQSSGGSTAIKNQCGNPEISKHWSGRISAQSSSTDVKRKEPFCGELAQCRTECLFRIPVASCCCSTTARGPMPRGSISHPPPQYSLALLCYER
jgi:hypothetical protein